MNQAKRQILRLPVWRSRLLLSLLLLAFLVLLGRALYLQGLNNEFLRQKGDARYSRVIDITAHRGIITDRNGEPLAISTPVESVWASPQDAEISSAELQRLAVLLQVPMSEIKKKVRPGKRDFVYLKRQLPPELAKEVMQIGIPGIFLQREYRRYYPAGDVVAHLLGFTGIDDNGREGMELAYQNWLAGQAGSRRVIKDRQGHIIEDVESIKVPHQGKALALSIDRNLQYLAYRELSLAVEHFKAKAGSIVMLDAKTGEVLAMANLPSYNPNNRTTLEPRVTRNRAITDQYEPGSTLKPFTIAEALDSGKYKPTDIIQTAPGTLTIGPAVIHDSHPEGALTVEQVIQKSSNVGASKIALSLPREMMWDSLHRAGFGQPPHSGFPGEASGKLRPYQTWRPIEQATMSFGNGVSVSLLQLARAYTAFANDGELKPISLLKLTQPVAGVQIYKPETARAMRKMLEMVTQSGGTGPNAQVLGYRVAGKTGTAHKVVGNGYSPNLYVASFVGMAPVTDPRLIVAVMIDQPSNGEYYGGVVAAPVFSKVMAGALRMLGIPPDAPQNYFTPPEKTPLVKEDA
ncbi:MAG: peptidoglycan D,D-transpeptidase FtsI family protein [Burkholderiales bacterium]